MSETVDQTKLERAIGAFFESLAHDHPDVRSGDGPPDAYLPFEVACREAANVWLSLNRPDTYRATLYIRTTRRDLLDTDIAAMVHGSPSAQSLRADVVMVDLHAMPARVFDATVADLAGEPDAHEGGGVW